MFLRLHFVLNLLMFFSREICKSQETSEVTEHQWYIIAQTSLEHHLLMTRKGILVQRNSVIVYFLVEFDTCRCCLVLAGKNDILRTHLSVSYLRPYIDGSLLGMFLWAKTEREAKAKEKAMNFKTKTSFIAFYQFKFISFDFMNWL